MPCGYFLRAARADSEAGRQKDEPEQPRGHALYALVPVGVPPVRRFFRNKYSDARDQRGEHVGQRVDSVGYHGGRAAEDARAHFQRGERDIAADADGRQAADDLLFIH